MKKEIVNCLTWLTNSISTVEVYKDSWSNEYKVDEISDAFGKFYKELKKHIDWEHLTAQEAKELRFCRWSEESHLYLIPLWLYPVIPDDLELTSIGGMTVCKKDGLDTDIRFGCLAYGIVIKE